jgi:hypothetical protein
MNMNKKNSIVYEALGILVSAIFVVLGCKVAASSDLPKPLDSTAKNQCGLIIKYRADGSKEVTDETGKPLGPVAFTSVNKECCMCWDKKICCSPDFCPQVFVTEGESPLESGPLISNISDSCFGLLESFKKK